MYGRHRRTRKELVRLLRKFAREVGRRPEQRDWLGVKDSRWPSCQQVGRMFGSWSEGIRVAGLGDSQRPHKRRKQGTCQHCGTEFFFYGQRRKYCGLRCSGHSAKNLETGTWVCRYKALEAWGEICERCGFDSFQGYRKVRSQFRTLPVLMDVHHIDGDRDNNDPINLAVLCPVCHALATRHITVYGRHKNGKLFWTDVTPDSFQRKEQAHLQAKNKQGAKSMRLRRQKMRQSALQGSRTCRGRQK